MAGRRITERTPGDADGVGLEDGEGEAEGDFDASARGAVTYTDMLPIVVQPASATAPMVQ